MSEKAVTKLAKPQLRGLLHSAIKKRLTIGITLSIITGIAYKLGVCEPRKQRYAEFYKNYDADKEFEKMRAKGLFQSC